MSSHTCGSGDSRTAIARGNVTGTDISQLPIIIGIFGPNSRIGREQAHPCTPRTIRDSREHSRKGGQSSMNLRVGQKAPDFTLPSHLGKDVTLSHLRGQNVVLAFFPQAWTPI